MSSMALFEGNLNILFGTCANWLIHTLALLEGKSFSTVYEETTSRICETCLTH